MKNNAGLKLMPQVVQQYSSYSSSIDSPSTTKFNSLNQPYFETLSVICKWNVLWLRVSLLQLLIHICFYYKYFSY